ncbi:MAG TPA: hypothetical protein VKC66_37340 [Xanthobacteraceae bacterium]|nr:hypothetical protein [Xanthobacteraceae bacterium]
MGEIQTKPVVAMILAASAGGCLTGAEYFGHRADAPPPAGPAEPERATGPAKYDASWYRAEYWGAEYPDGFTVDDDVTLRIRATPAVGASKSVSCALPKGATYHPWNKKRVAADHLKFVTFTRIVPFEITEDYSSGVWRFPGDVLMTLNFKKGDRWSLIAPGSEGFFLIRFGGKIYRAEQNLFSASAAVGGKPREEHGSEEDGNRGGNVVDVEQHEWVRLKCATGAAGWIFYDEIRGAPGFSSPDECGYGCAEDRKPEGAPSSEKLPSETSPPGASSAG